MLKNILVPLDMGAAQAVVVEHAVAVGRAFAAKLWLVHVAAPDPDFVGYEAGPIHVRDLRAEDLRNEHVALQELRDSILAPGLEAEALLVQGPTAATILDEAARLGCELIIMGTHGRRGLAKAVLGSVSDQVLRANRFPVMIVPVPEQ